MLRSHFAVRAGSHEALPLFEAAVAIAFAKYRGIRDSLLKKGARVLGTVTIGSKDFYHELRPITSGYFPSRMT
jgi:hypothetical protein